MAAAPTVSIIMSVYNGEDYLKETLDSIVSQTYKDWELIAINDCSKDATLDILNQYSKNDARIKVYSNEVNLRLPASLNKAISLSCGKYIARMDADDICMPDRFEKQVKFMDDNPDVSLSSCRFFTLKNGVYSSGGCGGRCDNEALRAMLLVTNPILHPGVIAKAEIMKKMLYSTDVTCTEDLELWIRMTANNIKMQIYPEYLLIYRLHDKQISGTTLERQHKEVLGIETEYYKNFIENPDENIKDIYINSIYFKDKVDMIGFLKYAKWMKNANKKRKVFKADALNYALFEVFAEYKRHGISKKDFIKGLLSFSKMFIIKETIRRKKTSKADGERCISSAKKIGLVQTSGTKMFPVFEKSN